MRLSHSCFDSPLLIKSMSAGRDKISSIKAANIYLGILHYTQQNLEFQYLSTKGLQLALPTSRYGTYMYESHGS